MNAAQLKLYDLIRIDLNLPEAKAREFIASLDEAIMQEIERGKSDYKSILAEDLLKLELKLQGRVDEVRLEIKDSKVDMIKWFVGAFIALALMILGLYLKK